MTTSTFYKNYIQTLEAAQLCLDQGLDTPSLILVFTMIDSFAWAASDKKRNQNRIQFESWLENWVYPYSEMSCTPAELYAARCGVLHTLTSKADLHSKEDIREIAYAWGAAKLSTLQNSARIINRSDIAFIHINELLDAVKEGIFRTIEASKTDQDLAEKLAHAASLHFSKMPKQILETLVANQAETWE